MGHAGIDKIPQEQIRPRLLPAQIGDGRVTRYRFDELRAPFTKTKTPRRRTA